ASTQQINYLCLKLSGVVSPIAVDFPRIRPEGATRCRTPRMHRVICAREFVIAADARGHSDLACRRLLTNYLAFTLARANDLDAEINIRRCTALVAEMVEKAIMPGGPQALVLSEELPDEIKGGFPGASNVSSQDASSNRG